MAALGYAQYLPKEQFLYQTEQLFDEMCMALGGRAAEELIFGKISTGALSDLERITKVAYSIVTIYGMNDKIGNVSYYDSKQSEYNFQKPYSEATAELIDKEVKKLIDEAYDHTKKLLKERSNELEVVAQKLLEKEIIFQADLEELIGKRPFAHQTTYEQFTQNKNINDEREEEEAKEAKKKADNIEKIKANIRSEVEDEQQDKPRKSDASEDSIEEELEEDNK